ncbi:hypothetical protein FKP32DRAFT_1588934 [Trametes sanguinea]|nr:hypothetical protein FKP32DRAFT_1588934 [Trametes sanguinea]
MAPRFRRRSRRSSAFATASLVLAICTHAVSASSPLVDFDRMGKVGLAGAFAGLDVVSNSSSVTFDPSTASLLARSADGSLSKVASTNAGGSILAGCAIGDVYYVAGNFSSIGGTSASNIASYSTSSGSFSALGSNGPNGVVRALYCDASRKQVWAGGQFSSPGASVAVWDTASSSWSAAPFGGLTGAAAEVFSITPNSSQSSLFFSGSFIASFGNGSIALNGTNNPNVPFSSGATPFSSSLVPVPLENASVDAGPSSSDSQFSNAQNILCPAGADGPGNTWLAADGNKAVITVRKFAFLTARGVRLGNTFLNGRGTTGFSVATIPDNAVQQLTYLDPTDNQNKTCTDPCPLLTDPSVPYQDFLFDGDKDITGFQLTLSEWQGSGPGLHLLQLLSSGAFASAIDSQNGQSCFAPAPSNTSRTGDWKEADAVTTIPGTTQAILVSTVKVGTPSNDAPSFTWMPYVSASGEYDVNLLVPGCTDFQDCPLRTTVKVTVFPGGGQQPWVTTVSQQNTADAAQLIYRGPVVPTSPSFQMTVTLTLADDPAGNGQNGEYELVADRVQLILTSPNVTSSGNSSSAGGNSTAAAERGFGFLEWPLSGSSTTSASNVIPTSAVTTLDNVGFDLLNALGGASTVLSTSSAPSIASAVQHPSGAIFLGGQFSLSSGSASGASNIVMFKNGALVALPNGGLNGPVTSLAVNGDNVYVGGTFSDTAKASNSALKGIAAYSVSGNSWSALEGGVDGTVTSLDNSGSQILVAGNFTKLLTSSGSSDGQNAEGFAAWNTSSGAWANSGGFLIGSMTFVGNGTSSTPQFVAGNVATALRFGASGFVMLQNGPNGQPQVTPLGVDFNAPVSANTTTVAKARRSHHRRSGAGWIPTLNVLNVFKRQTPSTTTNLAPLPSPVPAPAPAVLAGAFWTNSTSLKEVVVIGGNFSYTAGGLQAANVAIYDDSSKTITPLRGNQPNGTVRSLLVKGDSLYVGGEFTVSGIEGSGFAVYDLANQRWDSTGLQPLQASSGATVTVRSITASPANDDVVIVGGSFAQAGSTACRAICSLDTTNKQWSALGNGIQGDVSAVAYTGNKELIAAGSIALADNTHANVASYSLSNSTWAAVGNGGDIPGPVTAVEVNDGNENSIFAAGRSSDGSAPFLYFWDGNTWQSIGQGLQSSTDVSQLVMVPLQNTHDGNSVIESDRVLMVSGSISDSSFGNASSVLFDGQSFMPYIVSTSESGSPGAVSALFHSLASFSFTQRHFLATGVVILISIAIAAGIVFLLALIEILWTLFARRDDKVNTYDGADLDADDDSTHRPSSLLEHINAATRSTILGSPFGPHAEKEAGLAAAAGVGGAAAAGAAHDDPFTGPDASNYLRAETPSDALHGGMGPEEQSRPAYARYSFDGSGEGELPLKAGQELEILDDRDDAWWYARDARNGQEGVVPASYVY